MLRWKIYCRGGGTFCDMEGPPAAAPGRGVLCIAMADAVCGRLVVRGYYAYLYADGQWVGVQRDGLEHRVFDEPGSFERAVHGATATEHEFDEVVRQALTDPDLPPKSAGRRHEEPAQ